MPLSTWQLRSNMSAINQNCVLLRKDITLSARIAARMSNAHILAEKLNTDRGFKERKDTQGYLFPPLRVWVHGCIYVYTRMSRAYIYKRVAAHILAYPCGGLMLWIETNLSARIASFVSLRISLRSVRHPCAPVKSET